MNDYDTRKGMDDFYKNKWRAHEGFWIDIYKPHQQVYASSLNACRNRHILRALPAKLECPLDLGCGVGDVMVPLSKRSALVVGVDVTHVNVAMARKNLQQVGARNSLVLQASATELPFGDGTFDALVMADVIEHVEDIESAMRELKRVLRPGCIGVCITPHASQIDLLKGIDGFLQKLLQRGRRVQHAATPVFERFLTKGELGRSIGDAGLEVLDYRRICFYPGPEGTGVFTMLMSLLYKKLGRGFADGLTRFLIHSFDLIEKLRVLNQKQMWVLRA